MILELVGNGSLLNSMDGIIIFLYINDIDKW